MPIWVTTSAPAALPRRALSRSEKPLKTPAKNPAAKASPAPVASSAATENGGTKWVCAPSLTKLPRSPILSATTWTPHSRKRAASFSGEFSSGNKNCASCKLGTKKSRNGRHSRRFSHHFSSGAPAVSSEVFSPRSRAFCSSFAVFVPSNRGIKPAPAMCKSSPSSSKSSPKSSSCSVALAPVQCKNARSASDCTKTIVALVGALGSSQIRAVTPDFSSSRRTKSPKPSRPTFPATTVAMPSVCKPIPVLAAPPPICGEMLGTSASVPGAGTASIGRPMTSATKIPAQIARIF